MTSVSDIQGLGGYPPSTTSSVTHKPKSKVTIRAHSPSPNSQARSLPPNFAPPLPSPSPSPSKSSKQRFCYTIAPSRTAKVTAVAPSIDHAKQREEAIPSLIMSIANLYSQPSENGNKEQENRNQEQINALQKQLSAYFDKKEDFQKYLDTKKPFGNLNKSRRAKILGLYISPQQPPQQQQQQQQK